MKLLSDFYKILITKPVALKLKIDEKLPLIEVLEIKKNKSFVAEAVNGTISGFGLNSYLLAIKAIDDLLKT